MSNYIELINPRLMTCKLLKDGEVVSEYKVEKCDKCEGISRLDDFGYQKGYDNKDRILWFCGACR